jgi:hypothetical protein
MQRPPSTKLGTITYEHAFHPLQHVSQDWMARCHDSSKAPCRCRGNSWVLFLGETLTQADITAGVMIGYMKLGQYKPFPSAAYPTLEGLSQRLKRSTPLPLRAQARRDNAEHGQGLGRGAKGSAAPQRT